MGKIHILDTQVANQIAAGEVIERPCSAVKEMIENALDANAKNIFVEIENGGLDLIKVSDDGEGIYEEDLPLTIKRHATSKISSFNDVYSLSTFGFRGEALASLAVISRMKIRSGINDTTPSHTMISEPNMQNIYTVSAPTKGTCIEARDLYYNVPVRKKFVRSNNHESTLIYDLVCKFALAFPQINFTYSNDKTITFSSNQLTSVEDIMRYIYKENEKEDIIHINKQTFFQNYTMEAWFYHPSITRKNRNQIIYFINDRLIESKELDKIIDESTYTLIPKGRFPICIIKLYLPTFNIDVNVHPSKKIIKFKNINDWKQELISLIRESLWASHLNVSIHLDESEDLSKENNFVSPKYDEQKLDFKSDNFNNTLLHETAKNKKEIFEGSKDDFELELAYYKKSDTENDKIYPQNNREIECTKEEIVEYHTNENKKNVSLMQSSLENLQYIGQLNYTFLLAQDKNNLYIIDQHTLHERILYEKFMKEFEEKNIAQQPLLHAIEINLNPIQEKTLVENIVKLKELGFLFIHKKPLVYNITTIPHLLAVSKDISSLIKDVLDELSEGIKLKSVSSINEEQIITASCKAAVKAHYTLTDSDVSYLLSQLSILENAHTCPHGRPIIMNITMNELYLYFKRGSY